ncbi:hypothetical protein ACYKVW_003780 [Klebsiella pneumoniae]|uniref:hypothetical protein n=1 Tax=Klebsiella pneumoniae TaxID=573 RepID=UPI0031F2BD8B
MERTGLSPFKELYDLENAESLDEKECYPKPTWMLNGSVSDTTWQIGKTGHLIEHYKKSPKLICFSKKVSHNELLTDDINRILLDDIRNSILYLNTKGKITRPERSADILNSTCKLIFHVNELQSLKNLNPIRSLSEISFNHVKSYFLSFNVDKAVFDKTIDIVIKNWISISDVDWNLLKKHVDLTNREFESLKDKIVKHLKTNHIGFCDSARYIRKYPNAHSCEFDIDLNLSPKEKTISNEISKISALYTARPSQKYKFNHDIQRLFSSGKSIFDEMVESKKTPLMPVNIAFHTISSSIQFVRDYGSAIREYFSAFKKSEIKTISKHSKRKWKYNFRELQKEAFLNTDIPEPLKKLNINNLRNESGYSTSSCGPSKEISFSDLIKLYTAAIWILIASFSAARKSSILTLKRSCFVQSPLDGLFDIILRIPKSSERWELEEVNRPIPDIIFDYGLEFAAFVNEIEERRGLIRDDNDAYLFPSSINSHSASAYNFVKHTINHEKAMSTDTLSECLDMFFDWIESPIIDGKRWYARTHHFRRFNAVLYFNLTDGEGLDELSWFLGHANLDQTFHYAEVSPTAEWIEEAEIAISKIGATLDKKINADSAIQSIIEEARNTTNVIIILEPLVKKLISEYKLKTNQEVRFCRIDNNEVFFYFSKISGD